MSTAPDSARIEVRDEPPPVVEGRAISVTFFEDRAEVTRRAKVMLLRGSQWIAIGGVSPFVDERTVAAKVVRDPSGAAPSVAINAARVRWRAHSESALARADVERLEAEERAARRAVDEAVRARARADRRVDQINALCTKWASEIAKVAKGVQAEERVTAWRAAWASLAAAASEAHGEIAASNELRERKNDVAARAEQRLREGAREKPRFEAVIEVDVESPEDGEEAEIEVTYRVPCALFRPEHLFRLAEAAAPPDKEASPRAQEPDKKPERQASSRSLEIVTWATVWHAAGEVWESVTARFSTARPARDAVPPLVRDDVLYLRRKTAEERSRVLVEAREQANQTASLDRGARAVDEMPGVDDGGEPLVLEAREPLTIAGDGRPHRVEVQTRALTAEVDRVLYPELGGAAHLRATATLTGGPLLAGPVRIARGASLVGRSRVDFIAPGDAFEIGFGPDDGVRARRHVEEQRDTTAIMGTQKIRRKVDVFLSNLSGAPRTLTITERIPVSEIDDVEITLLESGDFPSRDPDGFLRAKLTLSAQETKRLTFSYEIKAGSNVVLPF